MNNLPEEEEKGFYDYNYWFLLGGIFALVFWVWVIMWLVGTA